MTRAATAGRAISESFEPVKKAAKAEVTGYFRCSETPLTALVFLLPFVIFYELGTREFLYDPVHRTEQRIIAFDQLQRFFWAIGATRPLMPAIAVVGLLLAWHIARKDRWKVSVGHVLAMFLESSLLAGPLLLIGFAITRYLSHLPHAPLSASWHSSPGYIVLSVGAGIYEELVFRLLGFALLSFLFTDLLQCKTWLASLLMVFTSAIAFSAYHYLGDEVFNWRTFYFRAIAGAYFGIVFLCRGLGITAGSHIAYDVCIVLLRAAG